MLYFTEGVMLGLTLSILLGPIFVALTQTGIKHGIKAGLSIGTGIWVSDILVISVGWFFIKQLDSMAKHPSFQLWMGMVGGIILITFGILSILNKHKKDDQTKAFSARTYFGYFTKGFAVNFINPFTFVFWLGVMSTYVLGKGINGMETILLFGGIMATIVLTDSLKVILAKLIRSRMKHHHIILFSRIAGVMLIIFGITLFVRVL
ncbi:MAG: LysE family transporter [Saprospiraceae bacterium]|nr:LysE family transporter [Saprospiraceae bacterium]